MANKAYFMRFFVYLYVYKTKLFIMLDYNITQAPFNHVIVEIDELFDSEVEYGSIKLHIDPHYKPTENVRIYGKVVAVPKGSVYNEDAKEIAAEVQLGDRVYFHYLATYNDQNCIYGNFYKIPYFQIFCAVRESQIIPIGGWTLCDFTYENEEHYSKLEVGGRTMIGVIDPKLGLVTEVFKKESTKMAIVRHIGSPVLGEASSEVFPGDRVLIEKNTNFKNKIEGREYYTIRQEDLLGKALN